MGDYYGPSSSNGDGKRRHSNDEAPPPNRGYRTEKRWRRDEEYDRSRHESGRGRGHDWDREDHRPMYRDHGSRDDDYAKGWKCVECSEFNYETDYECKRCRAPQPRHREDRGTGHDDPRNDHRNRRSSSFEHGRGGSSDGDSGPPEFDEFGRALSVKPPKKTKWPPCFDTDGSAYVFDARSGMFYESTTDFFYDPKSKLYYGNKQGAYFSYKTDSKQFEELKHSQDTGDVGSVTTSQVTDLSQSSSVASQGKSISIAIKLKTKELPSSSLQVKKKLLKSAVPKDKATIAEPVAVVSKKHVADMDKWSERQAEKRQAGVSVSTDDTKDTSKVTKTAKGEPICLLCRRKFPTIEKLQHHEQVSVLHKENLAKLSTKNETCVTSSESSVYLDRAEQRRTMHGSDANVTGPPPLNVRSGGVLGSVLDATHAGAVAKHVDNLGESNIGNKLLQKLGWKSGDALGRQASNAEAAVGTSSAPPPVASLVKQEWDRIESMAVSNGARGRRSSDGGIGTQRL